MQSRIKKWGSSLGVRIPRSLAASIGVRENTPIDVSVIGGAIVIKPAATQVRLHELVQGITPSNTHSEIDWDSRKGREAW